MMNTFLQWLETIQKGQLYQQLFVLRPQMARAAQEIYNDWEQDDEGLDFQFGGGGICDQVSQAISSVISEHIPEVDTVDGGQEGDDHSWIIVYNQIEAYHVDIPPGIYERGNGYKWQKIPNVIIQPNHVEIFPANREDMKYL